MQWERDGCSMSCRHQVSFEFALISSFVVHGNLFASLTNKTCYGGRQWRERER